MHTIIADGPPEPARRSFSVGSLSDAELEDRLKRLAGIERRALVLLLAHLGEFDDRRLYADRGHPSLFVYCLRVLGYSEQEAYKRIQAARAARTHPDILQRLADGKMTLTAVVILAPHLRADNSSELLSAARGLRTRDIEALAASLAPRPDCPDLLRALPGPASAPAAAAPESGLAAAPAPESGLVAAPAHAEGMGAAPVPSAGPAAAPADEEYKRMPAASRLAAGVIEPLSAERHLFRFSGSSRLRAKYERAKDLLVSTRTAKTMEAVVETGIDALLDRLDPERRIARRKAKAGRRLQPLGRSRKVSAVLRDEVWARDGGRCAFLGPDGCRCAATTGLEIDHIQPYALGGRSDDPANLRLMCRAHNQLLARRVFGGAAGPRGRTVRARSNYP